MHRCWLGATQPPAVGDAITLSPEESAHVTRVLRMSMGDPVQLIAADRLYHGEMISADVKGASVRVLSELPSPECPTRVTLVQGLPKLDKLEMIVQKATELGAWDVFPVPMERSVARADAKDEKKSERLNRIALEAAKQSGRAHVPAVRPMRSLKDVVVLLSQDAYDAVWVAWEEEPSLRLSEAVASLKRNLPQVRSVALIIGPEGGISAQEIALLRGIGAKSVTLGKRILRTETAGLCALSVVMSGLGEL